MIFVLWLLQGMSFARPAHGVSQLSGLSGSWGPLPHSTSVQHRQQRGCGHQVCLL